MMAVFIQVGHCTELNLTLDLERPARNTFSIQTAASRSDLHLVSGEPHHEDLPLWAPHDPNELYVTKSLSR
jgi:hypothetical protein